MKPIYNYEKALFRVVLACTTSNLDNVKYILASHDNFKVIEKSNKFGKIFDIEIVSPILCYSTLNDLFEVVNDISTCCKLNEKSYFHIYCYCDNYTFKDCISLCNLQVPKSDLIQKSLGVVLNDDRRLNNSFIVDINNNLKSMEEFKKVWFDHHDENSKCVVDFNDFFQGLGIALKYFNATFDIATIQTYIDLANAMVLASHEHYYKPWEMPTKGETSEKRFMCDFLWKLGIVGKEKRFKVTRAILTNHLEGKAW